MKPHVCVSVINFPKGWEVILQCTCFLTYLILTYPLDVVKKLSMVVTPSIVRAGTEFHSNQKVRNEDDTRIIPERNNMPVIFQNLLPHTCLFQKLGPAILSKNVDILATGCRRHSRPKKKCRFVGRMVSGLVGPFVCC